MLKARPLSPMTCFQVYHTILLSPDKFLYHSNAVCVNENIRNYA